MWPFQKRDESPFLGKDLIDVQSITKSELEYIIELSASIKPALEEKNQKKYKLAKDKDMFAALLFYEPSTRTRCSFEIAAKKLGMSTVGFSGTEATSVKKGENLLDTVDMYDAYNIDTAILRHPLDGAAKAAAEHIKNTTGRTMPCFNGGDGMNEHPSQAILDAFTIKECCGRLHDLEIGLAGDAKYGRTVHSLPVLLSLFPNIRFHIFTHELLRMPQSVLSYLDSAGVEYHEHHKSREQLKEMLPKLDFLYMTRVQKERLYDEAEFYKAKDMFCFTPELIELTKENFGLGHPLPNDKEHPSIHPQAKKHPKYWAKRQAGNGIPTRLVEIALSLGLLGHDFKGELHTQKEASNTFYKEREPANKKEIDEPQIRPIENGTVIDHIEKNPYAVNKIAELLGVEKNKDQFRLSVTESTKRKGTIKGLLMIKDRHLTEKELLLTAAVIPGATVNTIESRKVTKKIDLALPEMLEELPNMQCTNPRCITRPEHHEHVNPKATRVGNEGLVKCLYCNNLMKSHEMF